MPDLLQADCAIAGGGPAGMMLGLLLARAGRKVIVAEKHDDFLRDFRGDTLHPSTLQVMNDLGLLDELLKLPHQKVEELGAEVGDKRIIVADFSHLRVACPAIVLMPQWDFLDFLKRKAEAYSGFRCIMGCEARDLIVETGRVTGFTARMGDGELRVEARLTVAADGRRSRLRDASGLEVETIGAPIDVLWFRLAREPADSEATGGRFDSGRVFVRIFRGDYWQCGYVIPKGGFAAIRDAGIEHFRRDLSEIVPFGLARLERDLPDFGAVSLLSVAVDRLKTWHRPGLLCIGDAAHAMSPVGGVGINLAIQDAVASANLIAAPLGRGDLTDADLEAVQRRRSLPTRMTQAGQVFAQDRILRPSLTDDGASDVPLPLRLLNRFPVLRRIPARLIGMGVRPECPRI